MSNLIPLVGVGEKPNQTPVLIVEPEEEKNPKSKADEKRFQTELRKLAVANPLTQSINTFLFLQALPVDTRHNVKIQREKPAPWAGKVVRGEK